MHGGISFVIPASFRRSSIHPIEIKLKRGGGPRRAYLRNSEWFTFKIMLEYFDSQRLNYIHVKIIRFKEQSLAYATLLEPVRVGLKPVTR